VKFIFATTEIRKVPVTVLSRCQRFDLRRVEVAELMRHLKKIAANEGAKADDDALAMIARAAEGSVRDGLSILDQAIATGSGEVSAGIVRTMLGLADRGRIFDLLEHVLRGEAAAALEALAALHRDGAEPIQLLSDLAEAVHITTRVKTVGPGPGSEALSAEEKRRAGALAGRLSIPILSRAWQMLIKGLEDAARAPEPMAAAEMVLIRIAFTADLPSPDDIIKALGNEGNRRSAPGAGPPAPGGRDDRAPLNALTPRSPDAGEDAAGEDEAVLSIESASTTRQPQARVESLHEPDLLQPDLLREVLPADAAPEDLDAEPGDADDPLRPPGAQTGLAQPRSFGEVVALAGARRDARLKVHLEEHVSLVKFDASAGSIDLFLLPGAPPEMANELREKLNRWTGRRWMVVLSKTKGDRSVGEVRREREAAEIAELKKHPAVAVILEEFPDAKIAEVREIPGTRDDETGTG
jgi:DNA polymerase-3 subunit gamma/tau